MRKKASGHTLRIVSIALSNVVVGVLSAEFRKHTKRILRRSRKEKKDE